MAIAESLNPLLARLKSRYAQSSFPRFLRWWIGELLACLPPRWRSVLAVEDARLLLRIEDDVLVVSERLGGEIVERQRLGMADDDNLPRTLERSLDDGQRQLRRVLLLPSTMVLRRTLSLPAAAAENLRNVLGFELDRQTPFRPEQVYYDYRVLRQEPGARQITVELALVQREALEAYVARLGALAKSLHSVDVALASGQLPGYNFLPVERRAQRDRTVLLINLGLIAASVLLVLFSFGQIIDNRQAAVTELEAEVEVQRAAARSTVALRNSLEEAATGANFLAIQKQTRPSMLQLIHELTRLLPDSTYLERLSFSNGEVTMTGQSDQAAQLVAVLQDSELLRSPSLSGPIQPDPRSGRDRFTINAGYGPVDEPEAGE